MSVLLHYTFCTSTSANDTLYIGTSIIGMYYYYIIVIIIPFMPFLVVSIQGKIVRILARIVP